MAMVNGSQSVNGSKQETVTARVKQCIVDAIGVKLSPSKIPDDMALLDKGLGLDSVSLLRLVAGFLRMAPEKVVELSVAHPPVFEPGTKWEYSNVNYVIAGMIIFWFLRRR